MVHQNGGGSIEDSASSMAVPVPMVSRSGVDAAASGGHVGSASSWPSQLNTVDVSHKLTGQYSALAVTKVLSSLWETHLRAVPYGIAQCHLPLNTGERTPP